MSLGFHKDGLMVQTRVVEGLRHVAWQVGLKAKNHQSHVTVLPNFVDRIPKSTARARS